jgi:hypothetical protein
MKDIDGVNKLFEFECSRRENEIKNLKDALLEDCKDCTKDTRDPVCCLNCPKDCTHVFDKHQIEDIFNRVFGGEKKY